eukprot:CAMPEP_0202066196 /NCGR_PEP_ID=MMETSP0963-20130614/53350_1 /ASSEMBLY_ACC=CAM_ASM_000494 /TAXON_ID=4773 /ORGANISM="Schizochytrium aggregatum, Strain ATCC28209" /LENGTH=155 /DNA_ID=CAMNT_0048632865 /DNA_START=18 /DNA_END=482 /DNA_ORIENTATION=-
MIRLGLSCPPRATGSQPLSLARAPRTPAAHRIGTGAMPHIIEARNAWAFRPDAACMLIRPPLAAAPAALRPGWSGARGASGQRQAFMGGGVLAEPIAQRVEAGVDVEPRGRVVGDGRGHALHGFLQGYVAGEAVPRELCTGLGDELAPKGGEGRG